MTTRTIWFISDTHFGHENFLTFRREGGERIRPFSSLKEMDETMIARWNERVAENDIVYHLGDVAMGDRVTVLDAIMPRLKGRKRLVLGNHDTAEMGVYRKHFQKITSWRSFDEDLCGPGRSFVACHYPLHESSFRLPGDYGIDGARFCVHGHIHERVINHPCYFNVCVEQTNYAPVSLQEILTMMEKRVAKAALT